MTCMAVDGLKKVLYNLWTNCPEVAKEETWMNKKMRVGFIGLVSLMFVGCAPVEMMELPVTVTDETMQESGSDVPESAGAEVSTDAESAGSGDVAGDERVEKLDIAKETEEPEKVHGEVTVQTDAIHVMTDESVCVEDVELAEQKNPLEAPEAYKTEEPLPVEKDDADGECFYAVYSEAEMNEALNSGDLQAFFNMLNANSVITMGGAEESSEEIQPSENVKQTSISMDFVDYMNARRLEQGLPAYTWSDVMSDTALERAEEIVADFSHNGVRNCAGENLAMVNSSNIADWYDTFYSSEVHRLNMLDATYHSAAAAVCQLGNTNYVVVLFGI